MVQVGAIGTSAGHKNSSPIASSLTVSHGLLSRLVTVVPFCFRDPLLLTVISRNNPHMTGYYHAVG